MANRVRYSEEKKQLIKQKSLEMLKQGIGQNEIARTLGVSIQYMSNLKKEFIKSGIITQEDIDKNKQQLHQKKLAEKKQSSKVKSRNELQEETQIRRESILKKYKEGKTRVEVMNELKIPRTTICRDEKYLIDMGLIKEEDIIKQRDKNSIEMSEKIKKIKELVKDNKITITEIAREVNLSETIVYYIKTGRYEEYEQKNKNKNQKGKEKFHFNPEGKDSLRGIELDVYNELLKGYQYLYIEKTLGITHEKCMKIVETLNTIGAMSRKNIQEARNKLKEKDKEDILKLLRQGYTQREILLKKEHLTQVSLSRMVTELKEEDKITEEEIKETQSEYDKEFKKLVLSGMRKGLTVKEIIDSDEDGYATESRVRRMKDEIIREGLISKKSFKNKNNKRIQSKIEEKNKDNDNSYLILLKKGLTFEEIAKIQDVKYETVRDKWYFLRDKYNISNEDMKKWQEQRNTVFLNGKQNLDSYIFDGIGKKKVENFLGICIEEKNYGREFTRDEIEKIGRVIFMDEDFLNTDILRFIIFEYIANFSFKERNEFIDKLLRFYGNTIYGEAIKQFRTEILNIIKEEKQLKQVQEVHVTKKLKKKNIIEYNKEKKTENNKPDKKEIKEDFREKIIQVIKPTIQQVTQSAIKKKNIKKEKNTREVIRIRDVLSVSVKEIIFRINQDYYVKMQDYDTRKEFIKKYDKLENILESNSLNKRMQMELMLVLINEGYRQIVAREFPEEDYIFLNSLIKQYYNKHINPQNAIKKIDDFCR